MEKFLLVCVITLIPVCPILMLNLTNGEVMKKSEEVQLLYTSLRTRLIARGYVKLQAEMDLVVQASSAIETKLLPATEDIVIFDLREQLSTAINYLERMLHFAERELKGELIKRAEDTKPTIGFLLENLKNNTTTNDLANGLRLINDLETRLISSLNQTISRQLSQELSEELEYFSKLVLTEEIVLRGDYIKKAEDHKTMALELVKKLKEKGLTSLSNLVETEFKSLSAHEQTLIAIKDPNVNREQLEIFISKVDSFTDLLAHASERLTA